MGVNVRRILLILIFFTTTYSICNAQTKLRDLNLDDFRELHRVCDRNEIAKYDLNPNDVIVDIGFGKYASLLKHLVLYYDSLIIYAEEIDSYYIDSAHKYIGKYLKHRIAPNTNTLKLVIGTKTNTNLPSATFDKVILRNTFHHMSKQAEMLQDIHRIMKLEGKLYVSQDRFGNKMDIKGRGLVKQEDYIAYMSQQNFNLANKYNFKEYYVIKKKGKVKLKKTKTYLYIFTKG
ncbi:MAG: hypothetical protein COC01_00720 [Bacteroidetes bacterium]|nr:MAG: hypothetical protein COC01_00720 [Bacteroidota bacterium]